MHAWGGACLLACFGQLWAACLNMTWVTVACGPREKVELHVYVRMLDYIAIRVIRWI